MNSRDVLTLMAEANPHRAEDELTTDGWSATVLLAEIDTRRQQMSIELETRKTPRAPEPRRDLRWMIAASAFVVTIAVVGLVGWLGGSDDTGPTTEPTTTTTEPTTTEPTTTEPTTTEPTTTTEATTTPTLDPTALSTEQVAFVESYFAAFNAGDVDAYFAHFADGFTVVDDTFAQTIELRPGNTEYEERAFDEPRFMMNIGTQYETDIEGCRVSEGTIRCTVWRTDPLIERTLLKIQHFIKLDVEDGAIVRIDYCNSCEDGTLNLVLGPWAAWMYERDPDLARKMMIHGNGWPVLTDESAALWLEYLPIYFEEGL